MTILEKRHEKGIEEGIEKGIEKGIAKGKLQTVKDFIKAGAETELIVKATKLSREQVEKIRKEIESK